ncbi:MAG: hypothetical protein K6D97_01350 [Clostridia bacterium]|nr:hypothetical protein [Clostridia bacterium]
MEERPKNYNIVITFLVIIILAVSFYAFYGKTELKKDSSIGNKALSVLDDVDIAEEEVLILKVKNDSSENFNNVSPVLIYYDANGMPFHEGWAAKIGYFASGETRCMEFYDTIKDYSKVELGLFNVGNEISYTDMRDKITYNAEKSKEVDGFDENKLNFNGENKSDMDVSLVFQIAYYSGEKLIYEDEFMTIAKANSTFEEYEYLQTSFIDGTPFPDGYTYEVNLVEAVEYVDMYSDIEKTQISDDKIDFEELDDDEKIEHTLHQVFKTQYGDKLDSAKITITKMYSAKEVETNPLLKSLEIKEGEIPFEAIIDFLPAEGADPNIFTIPNGEFDSTSGWVHNASRLGILSHDNANSGNYIIRNLGTGW